MACVFLWICSLLLKEFFKILYGFSAAGIVPCGGRKTSPRTSSKVQINFFPFKIEDIFWKIRNCLIGLDFYSTPSLFTFFWTPLLILISLRLDCLIKIKNKIDIYIYTVHFSLAFDARYYQGHWWGLDRRNFEVWPMFHPANLLSAFEFTL